MPNVLINIRLRTIHERKGQLFSVVYNGVAIVAIYRYVKRNIIRNNHMWACVLSIYE